jgi:hypothetical protein
MTTIHNTEQLVFVHQHDNRQTLEVEVESGFAYEKRLNGWNVLRLKKKHGDEDTASVEFGLPPEDMEAIGHALIEAASAARTCQIQFLKNRVAGARAAADCVAGRIGAVEFEFVGKSPRNVPNVMVLNISYLTDVPADRDTELAVVHRLENVEAMVPPMEHMFWEFLTAYVGGRHEFTSSIAITTKNVPEEYSHIIPKTTP